MGHAALDEVKQIDQDRVCLRQSMVDDFPLIGAKVITLREQIADQVM